MKAIFLICFLSVPLGVTFASPLSEKMQAIEQTYQNTESLQAEFIQTTHVVILEKMVRRPGRIFYQNGGRLRIEYGANPMTHYIIDGKTLWIWHPKEKQIETYPLADGIPEEALKFLTSLGSLRGHFSAKEEPNGAFTLKPKKKTSYHSLTCHFDGNHYLGELTIHNNNGNDSTYLFFNLKTNVVLDQKIFAEPH